MTGILSMIVEVILDCLGEEVKRMEKIPVALSQEVELVLTPGEDGRGGELCHRVLSCRRPA